MLTKEQLEQFLPDRDSFELMNRRYPIQSVFIADQMMGPTSGVGWFLAGYLFGQDSELNMKGFKLVADAIAEGGMKEKFDA